mgnify:CR=1 FL=1
MKNKYTILLTILCIISSCIYINSSTYDKTTINFSIDSDKTEPTINDNLNKNFINTNKDIDKNTNNIQNNINIVNINNADKETLKTLPGIGDTLAENIINYRENVSLFYDVADIKNVDRIGDKIYEKIKDLITVN